MYRGSDPRLRRTLNQISQNLESANESAQANLYTFYQSQVQPCLGSLNQCLQSACAPCFPSREDELRRRQRARSRGRPEFGFDFYDDWEAEEEDGLLGWGNDEMDRLVAEGGYGTSGIPQPGRQRGMSYGKDTRHPRGRRKSAVLPHDGGQDPTVIPRSEYLGFLNMLPRRLFGGGRALRYKPSAADLQEHPGAIVRTGPEAEPLIEESDEDGEHEPQRKRHGRKRSGTSTSGHTTDSLSSRGDLFPSDLEDEDDAVPLDDEFALRLERRVTGLTSDENSSNKTGSKKRPAGSRMSTRTVSSRSTQEAVAEALASGKTRTPDEPIEEEGPSLVEIKQEDERIAKEEEADVERRREAAQRLALRRGLSTDHHEGVRSPTSEDKVESPAVVSPIAQPTGFSSPDPRDAQSTSAVTPFPTYDEQTEAGAEGSVEESAAMEQKDEVEDDQEPQKPG